MKIKVRLKYFVHMKTKVRLKYFMNDSLWKFAPDPFKLDFFDNFGKAFHTVYKIRATKLQKSAKICLTN